MEIKLQKQTAHNGCVAACLAMLLDRPVSEVTEEFNKAYHAYETDPVSYAQAHGLEINYPHPSKFANITHYGYIYVLTVPSLNTPGMLHSVVCDCRTPGDIKVYDPATGQVYMSPDEYIGTPGTTKLVSWVVSYVVNLEKHDG